MVFSSILELHKHNKWAIAYYILWHAIDDQSINEINFYRLTFWHASIMPNEWTKWIKSFDDSVEMVDSSAANDRHQWIANLN